MRHKPGTMRRLPRPEGYVHRSFTLDPKADQHVRDLSAALGLERSAVVNAIVLAHLAQSSVFGALQMAANAA